MTRGPGMTPGPRCFGEGIAYIERFCAVGGSIPFNRM